MVALLTIVIPGSRVAAQDQLCFPTVPGITNCISGRFMTYWQQNGGLAVFGYPLTAAANQQTAEGIFLTQVFERNSFELHSDKSAPYDVLLGRLGGLLLERQGINWQSLPKASPSAAHYFAETGHAVTHEPFYQYWSTHGLQDPTLSPYQRSLALFGFPLTEAAMATNSSGDTVLMQWFERARFEYHPEQPPEFQVLLGLLGTEWRGAPPAPQRTITIESPGPGAMVASSPLVVSGRTSYFPHEGSLLYRITADDGTILGQGSFQVTGTLPNPATFSVQLDFDEPSAATAMQVEVYDRDEGSGATIASAIVTMVFDPDA
jgi:hypothetical protein